MKEQRDDEDEGEICYTAGRRVALLSMLRHVLDELSIVDPAAGRVRWVLERQEIVAMLRRVCAEHGDNDWKDSDHLGDVVEKHLADHLAEAEDQRRQDGVDAMGEDS